MTPSTQVVKEEQPSRPWVLFSLLFFFRVAYIYLRMHSWKSMPMKASRRLKRSVRDEQDRSRFGRMRSRLCICTEGEKRRGVQSNQIGS